MRQIIQVFLVGLLLIGCASPGAPPPATPEKPKAPASVALPAHTVKDTALLKGRRVEVHAQSANLTKDECLALIAAYRDKAGEGGQVSVRKPASDGSLWPWCVDNMDGKPPFFNDELFK